MVRWTDARINELPIVRLLRKSVDDAIMRQDVFQVT